MLVESLKSALRRVKIYDSFSYSKLHFWVLKYRNPQYIKLLNEDLTFYQRALGGSLRLVFDVGANIGDKAWTFRQLGAKVVCIEPDESCFTILQTRYAKDPGVALENVALGERMGQATFFVEEEGSYYNTLSVKQKGWLLSTHRPTGLREISVPLITLDSLVAKYGIPDYLKIDVEGYECAVFQGLSYTIPIISFEANLPYFRDETFQILDRFKDNKSIQYNLMWKSDFIFSNHQNYDCISAVLSRDQAITYDVFVYNR